MDRRAGWHADCTWIRPESENVMGAITDKLKGKAKRLEGRLTGDRVREAQGAVEETKGKVEGAIAGLKDRVSAGVADARARRAAKRATRAR
ncbi:MAG TPA: hypothetical protein VK601_29840 [Kofleriaceae bacterium]|nr:hypothetical protein [Kofleriaceae bacterium]